MVDKITLILEKVGFSEITAGCSGKKITKIRFGTRRKEGQMEKNRYQNHLNCGPLPFFPHSWYSTYHHQIQMAGVFRRNHSNQCTEQDRE